MKSNATARTTSKATTQKAAWMLFIWRTRRSGILEDDALDEVGHVFTAVGDRLEQFVDGLELDQLAHVVLFAEKMRHRRAHHAVGIRFELVDFFARFDGRGRNVVVVE